jgi:hypothetical protein
MFLIDTAKFDEYLDGLRIDDLKKKNEVKFEPVPVASGEVRENIGP